MKILGAFFCYHESSTALFVESMFVNVAEDKGRQGSLLLE